MSILRGIMEEIDLEMNKIESEINKKNASCLPQHLDPHEVCNAQIKCLKDMLQKARQDIKRYRGGW